MLIENSFFEVSANYRYARCEGGLYEDGKCIDTSKSEWINRKYHDVVATISSGISSPIPDYLNALPYECLSERSIELFWQEELNLWDQIEWIPVRVIRRSGKLVGKYFWPKVDPYHYVDAFDYDHSKYELWPPGILTNPKAIIVKKVDYWVLRREIIGSLDLFRSYYPCRWFASPRLKQLVDQHLLFGFSFAPVATWTD